MKKLLFLSFALVVFMACPVGFINAQGGVAINTAGALPDNSAVLDVNSNSKGLLLPRMTVAERNAIASPAAGLVIYNTDCSVFNFNAGTPQSPNWATLNSSNVLAAGVSISDNPAGAICAGTSVTFSAIPSQNNLSPTYQWKLNGNNVGTNSTTYTNANLSNGDVVTCVLSSSAACVTGSPATSNPITMLVNIVPTITGTTPAGFCSGSAVTLSASADLGTINWYASAAGGSSLSSGASFTVSGLTSSATYYVDAAANGCTTPIRTPVTATFYPTSPGQPGTISGPLSVVGDSSATYTISALPNTASYAWSVSLGTIVSGQGSTSITVKWNDTVALGSLSVYAINTCGSGSSQSLTVGIQIFYYTGAQQIFTVPTGVTSINIAAYGAQGGSGNGGLGGLAQGTLSVTPGDVLYIYVGGQNTWNGGGTGNTSGTNNGGDETDVRIGGNSINNWLIVAGGGGGGASSAGGAGGGGAACANGAGGGGGVAPYAPYSGAGGPGTCGGGGAGGYSSNGWAGGGGGGGMAGGGGGSGGGGYANAGTDGTQGVGGSRGANVSYGQCNTGAGGGGGYYGGGGTSDGQCSPGGGGGGSSWASGVLTNLTFTGGVQTGTGRVVITW